MNQCKRILGLLWIALAPVALYFLIHTAATEFKKNPDFDTIIQWSIFILVFIPIAIGLAIFGYYALKGEYDEPIKK